MKMLLKRWMLYLLLPAALVLLVAPLNTTLTKHIERETVFLGITDTLSSPTPVEEGPPAPDGTEQAVWQELKRGQAALDAQFSHATTITNTLGVPLVEKKTFTCAPALYKAVENQLTHLRLWPQEHLDPVRLEEVPLEEWLSFQTHFSDQGRFQYGNWIFAGYTETAAVSIAVEVNHLKTARQVSGGLCLLLSLWLLAGIYSPPANGIRIGKRSAIVLWDVIILGITALFMWLVVDFVLHQTLGTEWWGGDAQVAGMGLFWVGLITPVLALITTATALQTLWITPDGIALKGLTGMHAIPWTEVQDIALSTIRGPQSTTGGLPTKTVARHLIITGESDSLRILEPPYASTKKKILQAINTFAPAELREGMSALTKEWSSLW